MGSQRNKKSTRKSSSRKSVRKTKRVRQHVRKSTHHTDRLERFFEWGVWLLLSVVGLGAIVYCFHFCKTTKPLSHSRHEKSVSVSIDRHLEKKSRHTSNASVEPSVISSATKRKKYASAPTTRSAEKSRNIHTSRKHIHLRRFTRPQLVIVIDDVHTAKQLDAIRSIGYPVTPSIFPPYSLAPHTERLAKGLRHYMIHLPMESGSAKFNSQSHTLMRRFDSRRLESDIARLRTLFPHATAINNHTGSRFTSDEAAMRRLYPILRKYGFVFVDSRTSPQTKVPKIVHIYGDDYLHRDIFIDNRRNVAAILRQLEKAVAIAKKRGYAIAIGHPYPETIEALRRAKGFLTQVALRYMDEIYREE